MASGASAQATARLMHVFNELRDLWTAVQTADPLGCLAVLEVFTGLDMDRHSCTGGEDEDAFDGAPTATMEDAWVKG